MQFSVRAGRQQMQIIGNRALQFRIQSVAQQSFIARIAVLQPVIVQRPGQVAAFHHAAAGHAGNGAFAVVGTRTPDARRIVSPWLRHVVDEIREVIVNQVNERLANFQVIGGINRPVCELNVQIPPDVRPGRAPVHVVARLLRAIGGINDLDDEAARAQVRSQLPAEVDPQDLVLLDDLLGIRDPDTELPPIDPAARRRRLTALINAVSLARTEPVIYILEDAHWIDAVSESMLTGFFTVIPKPRRSR